VALLEVRNVTIAFGSLIANDGVTFDIEKGSIVGLIGPNGAGKTALFNCISGAAFKGGCAEEAYRAVIHL
jgi:branched-chain amino acid transport system ATP-binding protein